MYFAVNHSELKLLTHEAITASEQSASLDTRNYEGNILLIISVQAGGTGTSTPVIQDSEDGSTGWNAVDADALVAVSGASVGEPTTLSNLTTAASVQTVGLRKDLLKRYVRIAYSGGTTHQVSAVACGQKKYSEA